MEIFMEFWEFISLFVICVFLMSLCYRRIRSRLSVRVHCWFCDRPSRVSYENRNCWDCPYCDQYNGFSLDGNYNKPVPAQFIEDINHPIRCKPAQFLTRGNFLCISCQRNQLLKVKLLTAFEPLNEATYDEEISLYTRHLEKVYGLCSTCDTYVKTELAKMDQSLSEQLDGARHVSSPPKNQNEAKRTGAVPRSTGGAVRWLTHAVTLSTSLCSVVLIGMGAQGYSHWTAAEVRSSASNSSYDHQQNDDSGSSEGVLAWLWSAGRLDKLTVALCGLLLCVFSKQLHGKQRVHLGDALHILLWVGVVGMGAWLSPSPSLPSQLALPVLTLLLELFLAFRHRTLSTATALVIRRLSLEAGGSGASSDTDSEAVSSVSTSCRRRFQSPFKDSGDGPWVPALNTACSRQMFPDRTTAPQEVPMNRNFISTQKDSDLDSLGKSLGAIMISPPASSLGFSSGRSSVFTSNIFGPIRQPTPLSSGIPFPQPLIAPARFGVVTFSQPVLPVTFSKGSEHWGQFSGVKEGGAMRRPGHASPCLMPEARSRSLFAYRTPVNTLPTRQMMNTEVSKHQTSSGDSTLVFSLDDLKKAHLTMPRTRQHTKACSETGFPLSGVRKHGKAMSELDFPLPRFGKTSKSTSEADFPVHGVDRTDRTANDVDSPSGGGGGGGGRRHNALINAGFPLCGAGKYGKTISRVYFPLHGAKTPGRGSRDVDFPQWGMTPSQARTSPTTWWRDSASDLRQNQPTYQEQVTSSQSLFSKDCYGDDDIMKNTIDSMQKCEMSSSLPVDCDSTTPLWSLLKDSMSPKKRMKTKARSKSLKTMAASNVFVLSDDDDEQNEEQLFDPTNQSTASTIIQQSKPDWGWLQWIAVGVMIINVFIDIFLSWIVWTSRP